MSKSTRISQIRGPSMAFSLITKLACEQDAAQKAEVELHARHATGVAYAGNVPYFIE
jgi:hypothetical protein